MQEPNILDQKCLYLLHMLCPCNELTTKKHTHFTLLYNVSVIYQVRFNPLRVDPTKWSNALKQFAGCCRRIV